MSASNYLEAKILDHLTGKTAFTMPSVTAVALCTADPTDTGTGASMNECANANAYARVTVSAANWAAAAAAASSNAAAITFPEATGSQGTATHWAIVDSATYGAGNVLFYGALDSSLVIATGVTPNIPIGDLDIDLSASCSTTIKNQILDHCLGKTSYTQPTAYAGYSTADPGSDGTSVAEPSAGYAREATTGATWDAASGGAVANAATITFDQATGSQGDITHLVLFDALTSGNVLVSGALTGTFTVSNGMTPRFAAGNFNLTAA